ncbi:MAG: hypothetical protein ACREQZ_11105, partial [Woeseiaceae bacterium]
STSTACTPAHCSRCIASITSVHPLEVDQLHVRALRRIRDESRCEFGAEEEQLCFLRPTAERRSRRLETAQMTFRDSFAGLRFADRDNGALGSRLGIRCGDDDVEL